MSQPVGWPGNGIELGGRVRILTGIGDPNTSATADVKNAAYGSIFLRADNVDGGSPQIAIREERARRDAKEIAQIKFENLCAPLRAAGLEASKTGDRYTVSNWTGDQLARVAELFREGGND